MQFLKAIQICQMNIKSALKFKCYVCRQPEQQQKIILSLARLSYIYFIYEIIYKINKMSGPVSLLIKSNSIQNSENELYTPWLRNSIQIRNTFGIIFGRSYLRINFFFVSLQQLTFRNAIKAM